MNIILNVLNRILGYIFNITGDWGVSIILLTILIRIILLPISLKQRRSIQRQQILFKKIEELKIKYKNDKEKLEKEIQKHYYENTKSMLGCIVTLIQLPVISSLFIVINKMSVQVGTAVVPWIVSIKMCDKYFIIPIIYALVSIGPSFISYIPLFKTVKAVKVEKVNLAITGVVSLLITVKAPIAIGIYFITTGLFSIFEEIGYRLYMKNRCIE